MSVEGTNKSDVEPIVVSKLTAYSSSLQSLRVSFVLVIDLSYQHVTVVSNESKSSFFLRKHLIKLLRSFSNRKNWKQLLVDIKLKVQIAFDEGCDGGLRNQSFCFHYWSFLILAHYYGCVCAPCV